MLGNLGNILSQLASAITTGTIPVALGTIAIAVVGKAQILDVDNSGIGHVRRPSSIRNFPA